MELFLSPASPGGLKVAAAAEVTGLRPELRPVSGTEQVVPFKSHSNLPALQLPTGDFIFSTNAICQYLFTLSGKEPSDATNQWLEWEATQLQPAMQTALHATLVQGRSSKEAIVAVRKQLSHLDRALTDRATPCVTSDTVTVADVVLWGALYPLLQDASCLPEDFAAVREWFQRMSSTAACLKAVASVLEGKGVQIFKAYLQKQPTPAPLPEKPASNETEEGDVVDRKVTEEELQAAEDAWCLGLAGLPKPRQIHHPILPKKKERNLLITSALPYVNNIPHLGNIIGCVLSADVFAR
uniref:methionine--tRNA ligase, cytoplasmic-like n=1 Tax=Pristiophorus japonicus TaxID=55135 RepID=UPI00398EC651